MAYFKWEPDLDVHVEKMNDQHKHLIGLMETLYQINESDRGKEAVIEAVKNLMDYVVVHFRDEEAHMEAINFHGFEAHKQIHQHLLDDLDKFAKDFIEGDEIKLNGEFMAFLSLWINVHIVAIDTKYSVDD